MKVNFSFILFKNPWAFCLAVCGRAAGMDVKRSTSSGLASAPNYVSFSIRFS